jgi:hypothetical protein
MADKRHQSSHRSRTERMEDEFNRTSFRGSGVLAGWPTPVRAPRTSRADSCGPQGAEPICPGASFQPVVAIPVFRQEEPPVGDVAKEGLLSVPINPGDHAELAYVDERGGGTEGPVYGAECGGPPPTAFSSSRVTDEEADARSEWRYQNHCVSPPGRRPMGTHVAIPAPEPGGLPPDLPSTIGRERASLRTSYNVWRASR